MKSRVVEAAAAKKVRKAKPVRKAVSRKQQEPSEEDVRKLVLDHRDNGRKLARSILRRWRVRMPAEEIDSIVDLALCEAARRYSSGRGASFMTFFFYHLRGHLVRAVTRAAQASSMFMAYAQSNGVDTIEWRSANNESIWPFIPDSFLFSQREAVTPEHEIIRREKLEQCRNAVSKLDDLEKEIVFRSFTDEQPLVDIARSLGYSRCHISRVKKSALDRLKNFLGGVEEAAVEADDDEQEISIQAPATRTACSRRRSRRRSSAGDTKCVVLLRKAKAA